MQLADAGSHHDLPADTPNILVTSEAHPTCPTSLQQTVDDAAQGWAVEWSSDTPLPECDWPEDLGPLPPKLELGAFREALATVPTQLGLGWDDIHHRALLRLDDSVLLALLRVLFLCECTGKWPSFTSLVIIALLPKPTGGLRPIGLFPWLPKVWAKARRNLALAWEQQVTRPYLYAGPGRGADHAAWKQAARAEHASTIRSAAYGMTLIDLVKAFDRVPWHVVVREARRLGYSLWILRLSIAAYRADRVLRVCGVYSQPITPQRSLTAGSAFATTEMRLVMIHIVDAALQVAPIVCPTLYVDDLSAEAAGGERVVVSQVCAFTLTFCRKVEADHMTVSRTKTLCTASTPSVGARLANGLKEFGIQYHGRVTSLGSAMGSGRRRNATVLNKRLKAFRARAPRFRKLAAAGVCTKRLMRTGGGAALTYGQSVTGVSPYTLLQQRRAAAAVCAPAGGPCGQDLDLALVLADASSTGRADPAFEAHLQPIAMWSEAVWHSWLPLTALHRIVETKLAVLATIPDRNLWHHVRGPGAALIASAWRLNWSVDTSTRLITDEGRQLDLLLDPPVVVRVEVCSAVRRWRDRNIFAKFPHLGPAAHSKGLHLRPLWTALRRRGPDWDGGHQASLRAAIADRQWPQDRCWTANWAPHDRCVLCVDTNTTARLARHRDGGTSSGGGPAPETQQPEPTHEDISLAPVGTLIHRVCQCPHFQAQRSDSGLRPLVECAGDASRLAPDLQAAFSSGLFPIPRLNLPPQQCPPADGTFTWVRWLDDEETLDRSYLGTVYTDGSRIHDGHPDTRRLGWAFIVLNGEGHIVAAARGTPPRYVTDIPGAEAWALLQATAYARPGCRFYSDCKPCVDALAAGRAWACTAKRPLARVFGLLFDNMEHTGIEASAVTWMPSHTAATEVGLVMRGDGQPMTATDRLGNALADNQARIAAGQFAADQDVIDLLKDFDDQALAALKWLGRVTWLATHNGERLARDSHASRAQAGAAKRGRAANAAGAPSSRGERHTARCAAPRGVDQRAARWCLRAAHGGADVDASRPTLGRHRSHRLMRSGDTFWCARCGAYAALRGAGLAAPCPGPAPPTAAGGRSQQLRFLKRGLHPKTRGRMPDSVPWPPATKSEQQRGGHQEARGDELALSRSSFGQLQLRVRRRESLRHAAAEGRPAPPPTPPPPPIVHLAPSEPRSPAPTNADMHHAPHVPLASPNAAPAMHNLPAHLLTPSRSLPDATAPPTTAAPRLPATRRDPARVRRNAHPALRRSLLAPLPPRHPPTMAGPGPTRTGAPRRRLRGKQAAPPPARLAVPGACKRPAAADASSPRAAKRSRVGGATAPSRAAALKRPAAHGDSSLPIAKRPNRSAGTGLPTVASSPAHRAAYKRPAAAPQRPTVAAKRRRVPSGTSGPGPPGRASLSLGSGTRPCPRPSASSSRPSSSSSSMTRR